MTLAVIDSNVVLPLILEQHTHREAAAKWWDEQPDQSVIFTLPVRMSILRLLTNRKLMGEGVLQPDQAWEALLLLTGDIRSVIHHQNPVGLDRIWLRLVRDREPTPNLWTDAWLAAYAEAADAEMITFDRGFRSFSLGRIRLLVQ